MKCDRCQDDITPEDSHEYAGQTLCDDCYMDALSPAVGCDPWAVYLATRTEQKDQVFSSVQEKILKLVQDKARVEIPELLEATGLNMDGLQKEVVTLRHMEKVIWERLPDKSVVLKQFSQETL